MITTLESLTLDYLRKRRKQIFNNRIMSMTPNELFTDAIRNYFIWAEEKGIIQSRSELKEMDTIDYSKMVEKEEGVPSSAHPDVRLTDEEIAEVDKCWYNIIPPFKEGVIRTNRQRYIKYEVLDVDEEEHAYIVYLCDYAYDRKAWVMNDKVIGFFKWDTTAEGSMHCVYSTQGQTMREIVEANVNRLKDVWDEDKMYYMNKVLIPALKSTEDEKDFDSLLIHFALISIRTNVQLLQGKPKAVRGSGTKIKTAAGEVDKNPKPKIVRTLSGGIQVKSVKIPRPMSPDTIRKYTLEAWKTRGHVRRYKNGKTVWVKESVHHRKCLQTDKSVIPQTIIKVG